MAILTITKATLMRSADASFEADSGRRSDIYIAKFDAKPADQDDAVAQFMAEAGFTYGDLDGTSSRLLKSVKPSTIASLVDFAFEVAYETPESDTGGALDPNPLLRPDERTFGGTSSLQPYFTDESSTPKPVTTSAGEPFAQLRQRFVGALEITVRGNRASLDTSWASYLWPKCATNSDSITVRGLSIAAGEGLMKNIRSTRRFENSVWFDEVEWTIALAPNWDDVVEDRGFMELSSGGKLRQIMAENGKEPVTAAYPLNGNGGKKNDPTDDPATLTFEPYPKKPFGIFSFTAAA